jgi:hypothetical protein
MVSTRLREAADDGMATPGLPRSSGCGTEPPLLHRPQKGQPAQAGCIQSGFEHDLATYEPNFYHANR